MSLADLILNGTYNKYRTSANSSKSSIANSIIDGSYSEFRKKRKKEIEEEEKRIAEQQKAQKEESQSNKENELKEQLKKANIYGPTINKSGTDNTKKIAPVKGKKSEPLAPASSFGEVKEIENKSNNGFYKNSNAFNDGYQVGDVAKTILGTAGDIGTNFLQGIHSLGSGIAKGIAGGTAQVADWLGADEYAERVRKNITSEDPISKTLRKSNEKVSPNSILGEKSENVAQGVGNVGGMIALNSIGVPWQLTSGTSSIGSGLSEAYSEGATDKEAWLSAGISAGAEIGSEYLFGGIKLPGTGKTTEKLIDGLTDKIKSKTLKQLTKFGINSVGEGAEEVFSGVGNAIGKKLTYMDDKELNDLYSSEQALDDFVIGTITSALAGGVQQLPGNLSENNLSNQNLRNQNLSKQQTILNQNQIAQNQNISETEQNSLNLPVRDLNYVESARKYNIDTNNETVQSIARITNERGIKTTYNADAFSNNNQNAIWRINTDENGNTTREVILNPNADTNKTLQSVIVHELTHDMEGTKQYNDLKNLILNYDKTKTGFEEARKFLEETYSKIYDKNSTEFNELIDNEAVADILGNKLGDQEFINNLTTQNRTLGQKIYDWVVDKLNKINEKIGYKSEKLYWTDVKNKFENAFKQEYISSDNNIKNKFSIQQDKNGKQYVRVDTDQNIFDGIPEKDYNKIAKMYMQDYLMGETSLSNNDKAIIDGKSARKYTNPGKRQYYFNEKMKLTPELKNVLEIAQKDSISAPTKDTSKYQNWEYYKFNFELDGKNFEGTINIGIDKNGNKHFYEINKIHFTGISSVSTNSQHKADSINNSIAPTKKNVNTTDKYSIQESENNTWENRLNTVYKNTGKGQTIKDVKLPQTQSINKNNNTQESKNNIYSIQEKTLNPTEISQLTREDANTTPKLSTQKYAKGNKQSSFFQNITNKSRFLNEDFRSAMKNEENIEYYKTVTNKETLENAYNKLNENGQQEVVKWHSKDSKNATAEDVAEGWILLKQYQDSGDYQSAVEVAKKMRDMGTKAGQAVQAYNILSRLTPEGMFYYAQGELSEAYNKMVQGKSKKWIENNRSKFELTPNETQNILDIMKDVSTMEDGYNKKVKLAEIQKIITDKIPPTAGQSIKSWMRISMLFNPKTQVRNVAGNATILPVNMFSDSVSAGIDKLISKKTGIRTMGNTNVKEYAKGFKKGLFESYNDFKKGINTRNIEGNRFEVSEGRNFKNKGIGKALNRVDNLLSFMLDAGDRGFYEASFTNSINNQLVLNNTTQVNQDMIDIATNEALQRTWQDNNNYTQSVLKIRNILNNANIKGYGLGDVLIPFAKTPANLTKAIVDYSPVGLVKSLTMDARKFKNSLENGQYTAKAQHDFVQNLGKGTAGSFLYVLGYALAKAGIATGEADEDKDVKNFLKNSLGINSYSIKIGNKSFSYDWAQPIATPLAIMTNYVKYNEKNPDANVLDKAIQSINIGTEQLLQQSFMDSLNTVLNGNGTTLENLSQSVLELPARAIPTFSKQIADMVDGTQRTSFEYEKPVQSAINSIKAKIPGLSKTLPASIDTLGNEIKKYGGENNFFNVFINPANTNKGELSKAGQEIYNLYQETGDTTIFPRTAPYYINNKGEKITMDSEQRSKFQTVSGSYVENTVEGLLRNKDYNKLNSEKKTKIINEIISDSYSKAKYDVLKIDSEEYEKLRETLKNVKPTSYYDYKFKTEGMKKDSEKIDVIVNSNYSNKEKTLLYENYILSKSNTTYPLIKQTGIDINEYLRYTQQEFESDKIDNGTTSGKTVSGSSKKKAYEYVNNMNITYEQRLMLLGMRYALTNTEQTRLYNYVTTLDYSQEEMKEVFEKLKGFTVYNDGRVTW